MGHDVARVEITATLSRHNSAQDEIDNLVWEEFCREVDEIVKKYEDTPICPMMFGHPF